MWWIQFYQDGQRVRMTSELPDKDVARRLIKEHEARVTPKEPLVARSTRVTYDELRTDLVEHYQATESRDLEEAGCVSSTWTAPSAVPGRARSRPRPSRGTS